MNHAKIRNYLNESHNISKCTVSPYNKLKGEKEKGQYILVHFINHLYSNLDYICSIIHHFLEYVEDLK